MDAEAEDGLLGIIIDNNDFKWLISQTVSFKLSAKVLDVVKERTGFCNVGEGKRKADSKNQLIDITFLEPQIP